VAVVPAVATLPFAIASHAHDRTFGLATDSTSSFLLDDAKALGFTLVLAWIIAFVFVGLARRAPRAWPAIVAAVAALLTFVLVYLFPLVYEPAFNRFSPVEPRTKQQVLAVARAEGVAVKDVVVSDASRRTTVLNAYVTGLGPSRRVVLYDTLVRGDPGCQLIVVVAHELGHVKHDDVLHGTLEGMGGVIVGVFLLAWILRRARRVTGAEDAGDPRVIPFVAFAIVLATVLISPLVNWESRRVEASADRTAIATTRCPATAIALQVRLARADLDDLRPNAFVRWFSYTHPTALERIQLGVDAEWRMARAGEEILC
jgi:STE24 endopeptidase